MAERTWIVGSADDCDLRVDHPTVSSRHCKLTAHGDTFVLEDLGSTNGTFVAGQRIQKPRSVRAGDEVTLGQSIPCPWPMPVISITIGRAPDNDVVIPLDTVSSRHARLEREGARVWLVDEGSTNGTALGNPLNKIERVALMPGDIVFLGTHRIAADDLLAALPQLPQRAGTMLEASVPVERQPVIDSPAVTVGSPFASVRTTVAKRRRRPNSFTHPVPWIVGAVLSVIVSGAILHSMGRLDFLAQSVPSEPPGKTTNAPSRRSNVNHGTTAATPAPSPVPTAPARIDRPEPHRQPPAENLVRTAEPIVVLIGLRIDRQLLLSDLGAVGWACRPDAIVCPTEIIERLEGLRKKGEGRAQGADQRLVACSARQTLAILKYVSGKGPAEGFSLALLEAPLESFRQVSVQPAEAPRVGQRLATLVGRSKEDDPRSITWDFVSLAVDQVGRGAGGAPVEYYAPVSAREVDALGAPVFDGSGCIVGCIRTAGEHLDIAAIAQLSALLEMQP